MIAIIDYRAGNSESVANAFRHIGAEFVLTSKPDALASASGIVLPGVGSADETMRSLKEQGLIDALNRRVRDGGTPFLGICVGMQVLFDYSEEGGVRCLGWLGGKVQRYSGAVRVPQIGWNETTFCSASPLAEVGESHHLYFVNSYHCLPSSRRDVLATAEYGGEFCALTRRGNIYGSQCHLEKSGEAGLALLGRFANLCKPTNQEQVRSSQGDAAVGGNELC